jgi:hypothetical protein
MQGTVSYLLQLNGVSDRSKQPNKITEFEAPFKYNDIMAPQITSANGTTASMTVTLNFSKPIDPVLGLDPSNYELLPPGEDATPLSLAENGLSLDETGQRVTFKLAESQLVREKHTIRVTGVADKSGNVEAEPLEDSFQWMDALSGAPRAKGNALITGDRDLVLSFDRAIDREFSSSPERYRVLDSGGAARGVRVIAVVPGAAPNQLDVRLNQNPGSGAHQVVISAIKDIFGDEHAGPIEFGFKITGIGRPSRQVVSWAQQRPATWLDNQTIVLTMTGPLKEETVVADNIIFQPNVAAANVSYSASTDDNGKPVARVEIKLSEPRPSLDLAVEIYGFEYDHSRDYGVQKLSQIRVQ